MAVVNVLSNNSYPLVNIFRVFRYKKLNFEIMEIIDLVLAIMKKAGKALSAGQIVELAGIDRKEVDKAMKKLKNEGKIVSPKNCYWEPK